MGADLPGVIAWAESSSPHEAPEVGLERWRVACSILPDSPELVVRRSIALKHAAKFDDADDVLAEAIHRFPSSPWLNHHYADNARVRRDWSALTRRSAVVRAHLDEFPEGYIFGAIAALESGDLHIARSILRRGTSRFADNVSLLDLKRQLRDAEAHSHSDWIKAPLASDFQTIVIGGPGRTGTSIVRDIVLQSPRTFSFGHIESKFLCEYGGLYDLSRSLTSDYTPSTAEGAVRRFRHLMLSELASDHFGQPPITAQLSISSDDYKSLVDYHISSLSPFGVVERLSDVEFRDWSTELFVALAAQSKGYEPGLTSHFVEKTPHDALNPTLARAICPNSKCIWVLRDPRAVAYSLSKQDWGPRDLHGCCVWVENVFDQFLRRCGDSGLWVKLENLASNPIGETARVFEYIGLEPPTEASLVEAGKVHDWKARLHGDDRRFIDSILGPLVARMGYSDA